MGTRINHFGVKEYSPHHSSVDVNVLRSTGQHNFVSTVREIINRMLKQTPPGSPVRDAVDTSHLGGKYGVPEDAEPWLKSNPDPKPQP